MFVLVWCAFFFFMISLLLRAYLLFLQSQWKRHKAKDLNKQIQGEGGVSQEPQHLLPRRIGGILGFQDWFGDLGSRSILYI